MNIAVQKNKPITFEIEDRYYKAWLKNPEEKELLLSKVVKEEWECLVCGCKMQLRSWRKENTYRPHFYATDKHLDPECIKVKNVLEKDAKSQIKFFKKRKYNHIAYRVVKEISELGFKVPVGITFKIYRENIKIVENESHGIIYKNQEIGNIFVDGASFANGIILPKEDEEVIICIDSIDPISVISNKTGKTYTINKIRSYKYFIKERSQ